MTRWATLMISTAMTVALAAPAAAFTREPNMGFDRSLGHTQADEIESAISPRRDTNGVRQEVRSPFGQPVSTAIGNLISVEAGPQSTIILNALQINRGNQVAINGGLNLD